VNYSRFEIDFYIHLFNARFGCAIDANILRESQQRNSNVSHTASEPSITTASVTSTVPWLTPERLPRIRSLLLGMTLFVGLLVWIAFSLGVAPRGTHLITKLRLVGVMTWLYALVQIIDLKIWHSRFALRRRSLSRIPEALEGWLLGQMIAWFGIAYYALTDDPRWFAAGLCILLMSFAVFRVRVER
jgi:hypothetical protein